MVGLKLCLVGAILLLSFSGAVTAVCEISSGESAVIVEIQESLGNEITQKTSPEELDIIGNENEISLQIESGSHDFFTIRGKKLMLIRPLDRDESALSSIRLSVSCRASGVFKQFPVVVLIRDINDNPPIFSATTYETDVSELTEVGTTIFRGFRATDKDTGSNSLIDFTTQPGDGGPNDGYGTFSINLPHQGLVTIAKPLDYESNQKYYLTVVASDKASQSSDRLSATTTLTINIKDGDDRDPTFKYRGCNLVDDACVNPEYSTSITSGVLNGILELNPENIKAVDGDSLNAPIVYSFLQGTPESYSSVFSIDRYTGMVKQQQVVERSLFRRFEIVVEAEEQAPSKRSTTAKLTIDVQAVDRNQPIITPGSFEGFVNENAPIGTTVVTTNEGQSPLKFTVTDADIALGDSPPKYSFELTTDAFEVNSNGFLVVKKANLDRDPPNLSTLRFQVIARESNSRNGRGTSAPVTIVVSLNDMNDNVPQLPSLSSMTVQAGSSVRTLLKVEARDNDDGDFARIRYSIHHVSNDGGDAFQIDENSGELKAVGKLVAGEQYSILIQATDAGGKFSQTVLDILVSPGANTGGPVFTQNAYNVQVSEGASVNSAVLTVTARDPENDLVTYKIVDGNMKKHFVIDRQSGTISVARKLDRESVSSYTLIVQASDESDLYSTVRVNIDLTDINDRNPEFLQPFYVFSVEEGLDDKVIGSVQARDDDSSSNAEITYSVPLESGFEVDSKSGIIKTKQSLDYEKQKIHYVVVTAKDRAEDPRIATATVTVSVLDIQDEPPVFERQIYKGEVPENEQNFKILQVKAKDPDSISSITYVIKVGPTNVFRIDPISGYIYTKIPIDYEIQNKFELVIGTTENDVVEDPMATCTVHINIIDRNDMSPTFTGILQPITLRDDARPGSTVTTVLATDGDATAPGNVIKYKISGRGKAPHYFKIDDDTGVITVTEYLRNEPDLQYEIEVQAIDLGEPPMIGSTTVTVYVERVAAALIPQIDLGLSDTKYNVEVKENSPVDTIVKVLKVINKPPGNIPIRCQIEDGNNSDMFYILPNEEKDCVLRTKKETLDFETEEKYLLKITISSPGIYSSSPELAALVAINVIDVNDNKPYFIVPETYASKTNNRYLAVVSKDTPAFTPIVKITAEDADVEASRKIKYSILKGTDPDNYFMMDKDTGYISNRRTFEHIDKNNLPFKIGVLGSDIPEAPENSLSVETQLIVNVIEDVNRMILVVQGSSPDKFNNIQNELINLFQDHTGLIVGIEKMETKKKLSNNTVQAEPMSTDIWFYAIDPTTLKIVSRHGANLKASIQAKDSQGILLSRISSKLAVSAEEVRPPFVKSNFTTNRVKSFKLKENNDGFQIALIAIAAIIIVLGLIAVIYQCFIWSKYMEHKDRMKRLYVVPKYEPVLVEPSMKEYETQVLQMSVPQDEDGSISDLNVTQMSNSKSLENVSYITKDQNNAMVSALVGDSHVFNPHQDFSSAAAESSPKEMNPPGLRASSTATTARASSLESGPSSNTSNLMVYEHELGVTPTQNPLFEDNYSSEEESYSSMDGRQKERKNSSQHLYDKSLVQSTTEL